MPPARATLAAALLHASLAAGRTLVGVEQLQAAGWGKEGTAEGEELIRLFEKRDTRGDGALDLEQFTQLIEECGMLLGLSW